MIIKYFHLNRAPFIEKDLEILKSSNTLDSQLLKFSGKLKDLLLPFYQLQFILASSLKNVIFITQFAGYQSVIPTFVGKILNIKHYIILGGTDCNWLPSIKYGNYNSFLLKWATRYSLSNAYMLLPVNKELVECDYTYTNLDFPKQGYRFFFPHISTPYKVIPNGIELSKYKISNIHRQQYSFITTCSELQDHRRRLVKGIDLLLEVAFLMPHINITIIGGSFPNEIRPPDNVQTFPFVENNRLPEIYNSHQFYIQFSLTEGFPNALIEAMACGCVPIVSAVGAMPDIVDQVGYVLEKKDVRLAFDLINEAICNYNNDLPNLVNKRASKYDINFREKALLEVIHSV